MFKLFLIATLLAVASAAPAPEPNPLLYPAYTAPLTAYSAPVAYSSYAYSPYAYGAYRYPYGYYFK